MHSVAVQKKKKLRQLADNIGFVCVYVKESNGSSESMRVFVFVLACINMTWNEWVSVNLFLACLSIFRLIPISMMPRINLQFNGNEQ